jgi:hypothetical protein
MLLSNELRSMTQSLLGNAVVRWRPQLRMFRRTAVSPSSESGSLLGLLDPEIQDTTTLKSVGNNAPMTERHPAEGW